MREGRGTEGRTRAGADAGAGAELGRGARGWSERREVREVREVRGDARVPELGPELGPGWGAGHAARGVELGRGAWGMGRRCAPPLEGQHAAEQHEGEHAQRPHVHCLAVALAREQLGRTVARRAAARGEPPLLHRTQAEVGELDLG